MSAPAGPVRVGLVDDQPLMRVAFRTILESFEGASSGWQVASDTSGSGTVQQSSAVVAASVAFFLAELGDKTMLATITLATREGAVGTWAGSTVGMVAADALAIGVGAVLGARLPEKAIRIGASVAFLVFGLLLIVEALR